MRATCQYLVMPTQLHPDLPRVAAHLSQLNADGKLNNFTGSLYAQLAKKGTLSDRQIACIVKDLDKPVKKPAPAATFAPVPEVPAGKYALTDGEKTVFFKVDRPTRGKHEGRTFLAEMQGENHRPIRVWKDEDRAEFYHTLELIAANPVAAARRYGHHANDCSYCNHGLTDAFSRFYGIGPVCARRRDLPFSFASYVKMAADPAAAEVEVADWQLEDAAAQQAAA